MMIMRRRKGKMQHKQTGLLRTQEEKGRRSAMSGWGCGRRR